MQLELEKYFRTILFSEEFDVEDINNFSFKQPRLLFDDYAENGGLRFEPEVNDYQISFIKSESFDLEKIPLMIPIRNMPDLLEYTIKNLLTNKADEITNIVVIDDRSNEQIKMICDKFEQISYIRCDYDSGFNYAMLTNIGSYIMHYHGFKEVIFWNSDMYLPNDSTLGELIRRHRTHKPVLSGTKLVYPFKNWKGEEFGVKLPSGELKCDIQGKVQYGGSGFMIVNNMLVFFHSKVGADLEDLYVNCDKGVHVNNGAYCMIELEWLRSTGGLNPSFAKIFNDIDICLRAISERKQVHYYGKDIFLYHEESTNLNSICESKKDHQFMSDSMLFSKVWNLNSYNNAVRF